MTAEFNFWVDIYRCYDNQWAAHQCTRKESGRGAAGDLKRNQKLWNVLRLQVGVKTS